MIKKSKNNKKKIKLGLNWVFSKLREWVGTVTGKGDRWGRDRVGRSEPTFLSASTIALPHQPALHGMRPANLISWLLLCCEAGQLLAVCFFEACAGRRVV